MKYLFQLSLLCLSFSVFAESKIVLQMKLNPAGSFQAQSGSITGDLSKKGNEFVAKKIEVPVNSLKTENELRDQHLWKHLNYTKFSHAVLTDLHGKDGKATAMLEIAGVKKKINIDYNEKGSNVVAKFNVNAAEFNLPRAEYLGIGVANEVKGEVELPFKKI